VSHEVGGSRYIVSARGETQWVKNLRAAGGAAELDTEHPKAAQPSTPLTGTPP